MLTVAAALPAIVEGPLIALEATSVATALRISRWAYPIVNVVHVLGLAALFGAILVLDLRLLGLWRTVPARGLAGLAVAVAATGLGVAAVSGALLFSVQALDYAAMPVFQVKIAAVAVGVANAAGMRATGLSDRLPRTTALVSLAAWTTAIVAGRLIGYWES